jgi:hypothetical protein
LEVKKYPFFEGFDPPFLGVKNSIFSENPLEIGGYSDLEKGAKKGVFFLFFAIFFQGKKRVFLGCKISTFFLYMWGF